MPWTIAKSPFAGTVRLVDGEAVEFQEVTFETLEAPRQMPPDETFVEQLRSTRGLFQINGDAAFEVTKAFDERAALELSFENRGASITVTVERDGDPTRLLLHESGIIGTQFPFRVAGEVSVAAS